MGEINIENGTNNVQPVKRSRVLSIIGGLLYVWIGVLGLFFKPLDAAYTITVAAGIVMIAAGVSVFFASFGVRKQGIKNWWLFLIQGIAMAGVGSYLITSPLLEAFFIVYYIGAMLVVFSIMKLFITREDWFLTIGQFAMGVVILANPASFLIWGFIVIFILLILNGLFSIFTALSKK